MDLGYGSLIVRHGLAAPGTSEGPENMILRAFRMG